MLLLPMLRHSGVCVHACLVQAFQLFERHLEVVPDQSSHVPLSRGEEAGRLFVGGEQLVAPLAFHAGRLSYSLSQTVPNNMAVAAAREMAG